MKERPAGASGTLPKTAGQVVTESVPQMLTAALDLAASGWSVLPCKWQGEHGKAPLTFRGHHEASRDPEVIRSWWTRWPLAMIGAPVPDSMLVIDLDPRNNPTCLADLEAAAGPIPDTLTAWSGRNDGGRHHYFLRPAGRLTSTRLPAGVDLKANGYCIVPPSLHPATFQGYRWDQRPAVALPPRLRALLRPDPPRVWTGRNGSGNAAGLIRWVAGQPVHNRNEGLFWASCRLAEVGQLDQDAADELIRAAVSAGLTETEARRTVASAARTIGANA